MQSIRVVWYGSRGDGKLPRMLANRLPSHSIKCFWSGKELNKLIRNEIDLALRAFPQYMIYVELSIYKSLFVQILNTQLPHTTQWYTEKPA